jgi:hypothetical protein
MPIFNQGPFFAIIVPKSSGPVDIQRAKPVNPAP